MAHSGLPTSCARPAATRPALARRLTASLPARAAPSCDSSEETLSRSRRLRSQPAASTTAAVPAAERTDVPAVFMCNELRRGPGKIARPAPHQTAVPKGLLANRVAFDRRTATELDRAGLLRRVALRACLPAGVRYGVERNRNAGRRLVVRAEIRNGRRVVAVVVREVGFLRGDEIAEVRLHRGDVRLLLRVGELRNRDRGENADDDDDDQQLDQGETLLVGHHACLLPGESLIVD